MDGAWGLGDGNGTHAVENSLADSQKTKTERLRVLAVLLLSIDLKVLKARIGTDACEGEGDRRDTGRDRQLKLKAT